MIMAMIMMGMTMKVILFGSCFFMLNMPNCAEQIQLERCKTHALRT